jgi:hypothetical protein
METDLFNNIAITLYEHALHCFQKTTTVVRGAITVALDAITSLVRK